MVIGVMINRVNDGLIGVVVLVMMTIEHRRYEDTVDKYIGLS